MVDWFFAQHKRPRPIHLRPHPEEAAQRPSRRMAASAMLRDAPAALLSMRTLDSRRRPPNAQQQTENRLDRHGPDGLPDGGAPAGGGPRRDDLEPHPGEG